MGDPHGPNKLANYVQVHESVMEHHRKTGFVLRDTLAFEPLDAGRSILLKGEIYCQGRIRIDVTKTLVIVDGEGASTRVQTSEYRYHACVIDVGNVLRYCSPHPDHNTDHHVHRYDIFRGDEHGTTTLHGRAGWPHLGDVIAELHRWYDAHKDRVDALR